MRNKKQFLVCVCVWYGSQKNQGRERKMMRSGRETIKHRSRKKSAPFFPKFFFFLGWNKSIDTCTV
jgi:hypothetical protein